MLRFDLNISILLREVPFLERFERAASLGFGAVEFWWPEDENLSAIVERVRASGLAVALINFDAGDLAGGERGFLNDASRQEQFRTHVPIALEFAQQVGCSRLNALVVSTVARFVEQTRQQSCSPPWISPACPRSFCIRAGYFTRSCPRAHTGWNVPPLDQR